MRVLRTPLASSPHKMLTFSMILTKNLACRRKTMCPSTNSMPTMVSLPKENSPIILILEAEIFDVKKEVLSLGTFGQITEIYQNIWL
jgi:hypothetical protein